MIRFENFDPDSFLRDYWQRKPLLIRAALPHFQDPIEPEELAGLAMEQEVDARIVETRSDGWHFRQGPFAADEFDAPCPWTLLVQGVDHYLQEIADLRQLVSFLPRWRFDDIMVSYATADKSQGAGVGPHYDNYDVFLLQGTGSRRWRLGQMCDDDEPLLEHPDLRILKHFQQSADYTLQSGDVLYVPPRLAHWGTAESESLTYSLGFRAPRLNDMVSHWADAALESISPELLYRDPALSSARSGEITADAMTAAKGQLLQQLQALQTDEAWFGELATQTSDELATLAICNGDSVGLAATARLAWREVESGIQVFANGQTLLAPSSQCPAIETLCSSGPVIIGQEIEVDLASQLAELGCLALADCEG